MRIYSIKPNLDSDGEAVCDVGDDWLYIDMKMFEELADTFGLAVVRFPKSRDDA